MMSRLMTRREQVIAGSLAGALILGAAALTMANRGGPDTEAPVVVRAAAANPASQTVTPNAQALPQTNEIVVSVTGAVREPGVFRFRGSERVIDAIARAGGETTAATLDGLNLAAKLIDGTTLIIPVKGEASGAAENPDRYRAAANPAAYTVSGGHQSQAIPGGTSSGRININTASQAELERLPGIGPTYARAIIAYRQRTPFARPSDVMQVQGIGTKRYEAIRELIAVE